MGALMFVLLDLAASSPALGGPRIAIERPRAMSVRVRGSGFSPGRWVMLMVDEAEPRASLACQEDRSHGVTVDRRGTFTATIRIDSRE